MLKEILAQPGFSPAQLAVGLVMYLAWTGAYLCIIAQGFREKTYGVPWASLCFNVVWEFYFSFNLLDQRLFWFFLWGNRLWLLFDIVILAQFLKYGRAAQVQPVLQRHFLKIAAATLLLNAVGLATFTPYFNEFTGGASSMMMNFSMSILYLFMLFERPDLRGLSYPAAWLKMIGTAAGSVFLYFWMPAQFIEGHLHTHPDVPAPRTWSYMLWLYVSILVVDCVYIALLAARRRELRQGSASTSRICRIVAPVLLGMGVAAGLTPPSAPAAEPAGPEPQTQAATAPDVVERLRNLDLESLVVSVASKKEERVFETPASVSAITDEEIRRSGVRTVPDALRLVPGMEVAQINGSQWAVSARGFNDRFANKLLVLQDGRVLYTPQFNGVYWGLQDQLLTDVSQIEVVRGPGGTLWGANAVNGVVNIVTKDARDTVGTYASGGGGPYEAFAEARHGQTIGETGAWRAYVKYDWHDQLPLGEGTNYDRYDNLATGFRTDWALEADHLTLQGDYLYGNRQQPIYYTEYAPPYATLAQEEFNVRTGNVLGRWTHTFSDGTDLSLQAYFDHAEAEAPSFPYRQDVADVEFQHRILLPARQELSYGLGYRYHHQHVDNQRKELVQVPSDIDLDLFSAWIRDEIALVEDELKLLVGSKFEHNDFTGVEIQPDARLLWLVAPNHTLWTAVSRAIRTPSLAHQYLTALQPLPFGLARYTGNPDIESEELLSVQAGWRMRLTERAGIDLSLYYNFYDNLDYTTPTGPPRVEDQPPPPHVIVPVGTINTGQVDTFGLELGVDYQPADWWRLRAGYNYFDYANLERVLYDPAATPHHQFLLRSSMDLPGHVEFDLWFRVRSELELYALDAYGELDARVAWRPRAWVEVALVGQNLIHDQRQDFGIPPFNIAAPVSEVPRTFYGQVTFRF